MFLPVSTSQVWVPCGEGRHLFQVKGGIKVCYLMFFNFYFWCWTTLLFLSIRKLGALLVIKMLSSCDYKNVWWRCAVKDRHGLVLMQVLEEESMRRMDKPAKHMHLGEKSSSSKQDQSRKNISIFKTKTGGKAWNTPDFYDVFQQTSLNSFNKHPKKTTCIICNATFNHGSPFLNVDVF